MAKNYKLKTKNCERGQVLLMTVLVLGGVMVAASTIAGYLMLLRIRQSTDSASSAVAIAAADAGIEWDLYQRTKDSARPELDRYYPNSPSLTNGANLEVYSSPTSTKSIGKYSNTFRAFEVTFGP
ncbi:MAG: hypothetical protein NTW60_04125 [Candidatus Wolfebacteria bacterium]|nr:hypothetical protein [Candidatus Wolfebacteria bacterium]